MLRQQKEKQKEKTIKLALQGGGSHGAFTWGVLDRLLEEESIVIEAISGASAGAMNAAVLAYGLTVGGREAARQALADLWDKVADQGSVLMKEVLASDELSNLADTLKLLPLTALLMGLVRSLSPYQINPFNLNPLRDIVAERIDFERLRTDCAIELFIAATQVQTGKLRLFTTRELTLDMLMASACLPTLHQAVEVDGDLYWDGGFAANPAVLPLLAAGSGDDVLIVLLQPLRRENLLRDSSTIWGRITELGFNAGFLREMQVLAYAREMVGWSPLSLGRIERRLRKLRFHLVEAEDLLSQLSTASKMDTRRSFLDFLKEHGRSQTDAWLRRHYGDLGLRSSVNLSELFC